MHRTTAGGSPTERQQAAPKKPGLLISRDYALLWSGQTISLIGTFAFDTTLAVWVFILAAAQSWAPLAVAGVYIAAAVPVVLVGPLAGVFVDRWNKRRTMLVMDALRAVLVAALIPLTGIVSLAPLTALPLVGDALATILVGGQLALEWRLGAIYAVVVVVNSAAQFFIPSRVALIGDLVSDPLRGRAMGLAQASQSMGLLLGTLIAPPLVVSIGPEWTLAFDALSFVVSYLTIRAIHPPVAASSVAQSGRGHVGRELAAGIGFFARSRVLVTMFVGGVLVMLGANVLNSLDIFFVTENLHTEVALYGIITAATGAGTLLGSLGAAVFAHRLGYARTVWLSLVTMGALMVVYSRLTSFGPALALMAVFGIFEAGVNVAVAPLLLSVTPRTLIGRVNALLNLALTLSSLAGTAIAGSLAGTLLAGFSASALGSTFGPIDTIFGVAGLLILAGGIYCALNLRARTVERERVDEAAAPADESAAQHLSAGAEQRQAASVP